MTIHSTEQFTSNDTAIKRMNVLVLDDSEVDRSSVIRLCERAGLNCIMSEAESLDELKGTLDQTSFDLIFVDYLLGADTGLDAIKQIMKHENQSNAASIMIAGEGQIDIAIEAMRMGCADYLTKSMLSVEALQKSVASAIERRAFMAQIADGQRSQAMLEGSIRRYAEASTAEMRNLLSATLRRVRLMRRHKAGKDYALDLTTLEVDIDKLWEALPNFKARVMDEIDAPTKMKALH